MVEACSIIQVSGAARQDGPTRERTTRFRAEPMPEVILVSACLLGLPTRYDGGTRTSDQVRSLLEGRIAVPVCPEQLGGLPTPRSAHFIEQGTGEDVLAGRTRVVDKAGGDGTEQFLRGARMVARIAELVGAREVWFKEESPSCGVCLTSTAGEKVHGPGVTTALLQAGGLKVLGFE